MSINLFGSFPCTIENGRIKIPAPFCKALKLESKQPFHITMEDAENSQSLYLYSQAQWESRVESLMSLNKQDGGTGRLRRIADKYFAVDIDKNGRMTIPQNAREAAGLEKKVVVVGLFDHMEIWEYEAFERSQGRM